jgi:arsenate reductase (glutaredoxin)
MDVTIYHNPMCGTSRSALAMIREAGIEPEVIEYLRNPPSRDELAGLVERMGICVRDVLRTKEVLVGELGLDDPAVGDAALLDAMAAHPVLINRPIVVSPAGVRLCRPAETVRELLPDRA